MALQQRHNKGLASLSEALSEFTLELYKGACGGDQKDGNAILSPYSISAAMMLTMLGCAGSTKSQIMKGLHLSELSTENVHGDYQKLHTQLNSLMEDGILLSVANKIFPKSGLLLQNNYITNSKEYYGSKLEAMDYVSDPESCRKKINEWVEEKTSNKIKDLIPSGAINGLTLIVLANAVYFKGQWDKKFPVESTTDTDFHLSKGEIKTVKMMKPDPMDSEFLCCESTKYQCKALELPYKGKQMSMVLLLPNEEIELSVLEKQLTFSVLKEITAEMYMREAILELPRFKIEADYDLKQILERMDIVDIFNPEKANMSDMFQKTGNGEHISAAVHKAFIEVNEEGTEAAAATAMIAMCYSLGPPPLEFIANRSFLFYIKEKVSDTILFIGRFSNPPEDSL